MDFIKPMKNKKNLKKEIFEFTLYNIDPKMDIVYDKSINIKHEDNLEKDFCNIKECLENNIVENKKINNNKLTKYLSMVDIENNDIQTCNKICFNCHRNFDSSIIGVPIKYIPHVLTTIIHTDNNMIKLKKNLSIKEYNNIKNNLHSNQNIIEGDYFITDSIVCSFNCALSIYNTDINYYKETPQLINLMYYKIYNKFPEKLLPAPSFKLRKKYNGCLSDNEYGNLLQTHIIEHPQLQYKIVNKLFESY